MSDSSTSEAVGMETAAFLKQLLRGVAHDLNNTLSPVIGYPEILADLFDPQSPEHADLMEIRSLALRTVGIIKDLQWILRDESGPSHLLDLGKAVGGAMRGDAVKGLRSAHPGIPLEWVPAGAPLPVSATEADLEKIAECLLSMALTAADKGGRVDVRACEDQGFGVLEVKVDRALGDLDKLALLDGPFHLKKVLGWGVTGLEWHIVRVLSTRHGGEVRAAIIGPGQVSFQLRLALCRSRSA